MKKTFLLVLLVALYALIVSTGAFAQGTVEGDGVLVTHPTQLIGTIRFCVEEVQKLAGLLNEAICDGDDVSYNAKLADMANMITRANSAMADSAMPNTLNLWAVYAAARQRKANGCGAGTDPVSLADWSREELDRVGQKIGTIEFDNCPYGFTRTWTRWYYGVNKDDGSTWWYAQNHDLNWVVESCNRNGSLNWKVTSGDYFDEDPDTTEPEWIDEP